MAAFLAPAPVVLGATNASFATHCTTFNAAQLYQTGRCRSRARVRVQLPLSVSIRACTSDEFERGELIQDGLIAPLVSKGVVGVYGVEDSNGVLRHVGISRDCWTSLARALVRQPELAHRYRLRRFSRPSRAALEEVRSLWAGDATDSDSDWSAWELDSEARKDSDNDPRLLKKACRVRQKEVEQALQQRGLTEPVAFAPKLKEKGILDVASQRIKVPETI